MPVCLDQNRKVPVCLDQNRKVPVCLDQNRKVPVCLDQNRKVPVCLDQNRKVLVCLDQNRKVPVCLDQNRTVPVCLDQNRKVTVSGSDQDTQIELIVVTCYDVEEAALTCICEKFHGIDHRISPLKNRDAFIHFVSVGSLTVFPINALWQIQDAPRLVCINRMHRKLV